MKPWRCLIGWGSLKPRLGKHFLFFGGLFWIRFFDFAFLWIFFLFSLTFRFCFPLDFSPYHLLCWPSEYLWTSGRPPAMNLIKYAQGSFYRGSNSHTILLLLVVQWDHESGMKSWLYIQRDKWTHSYKNSGQTWHTHPTLITCQQALKRLKKARIFAGI